MSGVKLLKNFSAYTFGQFLTQMLSFILLPIYISQLSQEEYGIVGFFMATATLLNAIMQFGLSPTIMRYYYDYKDSPLQFKSFFSTLLVFILMANILISLVLLNIGEHLLKNMLSDVNILDYLFYVVGYSFLFTFPLLNLSLFRVHGEAKKYLLFNVFQFFLSFLMIYFFIVIQKEGALGKIKGEFWARLPIFLFSFYLYSKYFTIKNLKVKHLKRSLNFGLPLMFQSLLWWGLYRLDYFLISGNLGSESLGLYNVAFQISFIVITLGISFSLAWTPYFFSIAKIQETKVLYGNILGNYFMLLSLIGVSILFFGEYFLELIGGEKYSEIFEFLPFLLLGAIFQSSYYLIHQTIQYSKKTWSIPLILGLGVLVGFWLEYLAIDTYQLFGLSLVKAATYLVVLLLTFYIGQKFYKIIIPTNKVIISVVFLMISFTLGYVLEDNLYSVFIKVFTIVFSLFGLWFLVPFFNKEEREFLLKKITRK